MSPRRFANSLGISEKRDSRAGTFSRSSLRATQTSPSSSRALRFPFLSPVFDHVVDSSIPGNHRSATRSELDQSTFTIKNQKQNDLNCLEHFHSVDDSRVGRFRSGKPERFRSSVTRRGSVASYGRIRPWGASLTLPPLTEAEKRVVLQSRKRQRRMIVSETRLGSVAPYGRIRPWGASL